MAATPLHLGPGCFVGLIFRRWLDLPVFLMGNVVVDLEVPVVALLQCGPIFPRYGHTLLFAAAGGIVCAAAAYPLRGILRRAMSIARLPYETGFGKMAVSGLLGAWLHVLIDGLYRVDVVLFWPLMVRNPLCRFGKREVETWCLVLCFAAILPYAVAVVRGRSERRSPTAHG